MYEGKKKNKLIVCALLHHGFTRTQIEAMQIMWSVLRDNEQVPNVQKSLSHQMVRITLLSYLCFSMSVSSELSIRLPFAAFAALFTEGREMQVGVGPGPEPARF